jgi:hypothetical protein
MVLVEKNQQQFIPRLTQRENQTILVQENHGGDLNAHL